MLVTEEEVLASIYVNPVSTKKPTTVHFTDTAERNWSVYSDGSPLINDDFNVASADDLIGAVAILLTTLGITGNLLFFFYLCKKENKSIYDLLYSVISILDLLISITSLPVIVSLLSSRAPMLFDNVVVCQSWPVLFYILIRVSMLLVIFISVTRTIAIVKPFDFNNVPGKIKKMVLATMSYSVLLLTIDIVLLFTEDGLVGDGIRYIKRAAFCEVFIDIEQSEKEFESGWPTLLYQALLQLELILPCLVVLASFLVSTIILLRKQYPQTQRAKEFRSVSTTIGLFTALFLLCYLPCFLLQVINFVSLFRIRVTITENRKFLQYSYLVIQFLLPQLNGAINPILYFLRMPQYRRWIALKVCPSKTLGRSKVGGIKSFTAKGMTERKLTGSSV